MSGIEKFRTVQGKQKAAYEQVFLQMQDVRLKGLVPECVEASIQALLALDKPEPQAVMIALQEVYKQFGLEGDLAADASKEFMQKVAKGIIERLQDSKGLPLFPEIDKRVQEGGAKTDPMKEFFNVVSEVLSQKSSKGSSPEQSDLLNELGLEANELKGSSSKKTESEPIVPEDLHKRINEVFEKAKQYLAKAEQSLEVNDNTEEAENLLMEGLDFIKYLDNEIPVGDPSARKQFEQKREKLKKPAIDLGKKIQTVAALLALENPDAAAVRDTINSVYKVQSTKANSKEFGIEISQKIINWLGKRIHQKLRAGSWQEFYKVAAESLGQLKSSQETQTTPIETKLSSEQLEALENHPAVKTYKQGAFEEWASQSDPKNSHSVEQQKKGFEEWYWQGNREEEIGELTSQGYINLEEFFKIN